MQRRQLLTLALLCLLAPALLWAEPGQYNTTCSKGSTFVRVLTWRDSGGSLVNLTGYTARLTIRSGYHSTSTQLLDLTQASGLTLGGVAGTITWALTSTQTGTLPVGVVYYDLKLTSGAGDVTYLLYGSITVAERVTQ